MAMTTHHSSARRSEPHPRWLRHWVLITEVVLVALGAYALLTLT